MMVMRARENSIGAWAFLVGVILAIMVGVLTSLIKIPLLSQYNAQIYALLVLLGIVIGFIDVNEKDTQTFLMASTVLVIASRFGLDGIRGSLIGIEIGGMVSAIFAALLALFVPATIVVALKTVFSITKV